LHFLQFVEHALDAFTGEGVLVARLRSRQDVEVVELLVADERLIERCFALNDIDEVIHHAAFATHDEIQVAKADIEIDHSGFMAAHGQTSGKAGAGGGFAYPTLAGSDDNDTCHNERILVLEKLVGNVGTAFYTAVD